MIYIKKALIKGGISMISKRLLVGALVPIFGAAAVVGSGFSVFIFDGNNVVSINGNVQVEDAKDGTSIEAKHKKVTLVFDQTANTMNANGKGVYFDFEAETGVNDGDKTKAEFKYGESTVNKTYEVELTLKSATAAYIELTAGTTGYTLTTSTESDSKTYTFTLANQSATSTFNWANLSLAYANEKEPKDKAAWTTLNGVDKTMTVGYSIVNS